MEISENVKLKYISIQIIFFFMRKPEAKNDLSLLNMNCFNLI